MAGSIVMVFLTVPAEAREAAFDSLAGAETGYREVTATTAFAYVESAGTQLENKELLLVSDDRSARAGDAPSVGGDVGSGPT